MKGPKKKGENIKMINAPKYVSKNRKWAIVHLVNSLGEHFFNVHEKRKRGLHHVTVIHMVKIYFVNENDIFWDGTIATEDEIILKMNDASERVLPKSVKKEMYKIAMEIKRT